MKPRKPRVWLAAGAAVWVVVLVAAGIQSARHGRPTVIEQTTIVEALPTVDRAIAAVVAAAAGPRVVVGLGGYQRTDDGCEAGNRDGERYQRAASVYTVPGEEAALIDRVTSALPAAYRAAVRQSRSGPVLRADAGFYVRLTGGVTAPGELRFTADTGCRVRGGAVPEAATAGSPPSADDVLTRLGVAGTRASSYGVRCPSGGELRAITVTAPRPGGPLAAALPAGVAPIIAREELVVFEQGGLGVAAHLRAEDVVVTAATGCR